MNPPANRPGIWLVWLAFAVLAALGPGTAELPLLDRDEPRFATATREMRDTGEWLVPTFNGQDRFDKPILIYWLMRATYAVGGVHAFTARLPSLLCTLALVVFVAWTADRWWGRRAGLLAGLSLGTSLQIFIHGRLAVADLPMVLGVTVAMIALIELLDGRDEPRRAWWWALFLALGLGFLAKGPIAWAVPMLAVLGWRWVLRRAPVPWSRLQLGRGLALTLGVVALWGLPALAVTAGRFFAVGIGEHVVQRGVAGFNSRGYAPWFYLFTTPLALFPWIAWAGPAWAAVRQRRADPRMGWLAAWFLAPVLIFSFYATQLPHYVLPAFPAFCLLAARGVASGWGRRSRGWGELALAFAAGIATMLGALMLGTTVPNEAAPLRWAVCGVAFVLLSLSILPPAAARGRWALVTVGVVGIGLGGTVLARSLRAVSLSPRVASELTHMTEGTRLIGWGFAEPSLVFYTGQRWLFPVNESELEALLTVPGPVVLVTLERECDPAGFATSRLAWRESETPAIVTRLGRTQSAPALLVPGFNPGRSRWQELRVRKFN